MNCTTVSFFLSALLLQWCFSLAVYTVRVHVPKAENFWLTVSWNPFVNASVTIITATLIVVAGNGKADNEP